MSTTSLPWKLLSTGPNVLIGIPQQSVAYVANDRAQVFHGRDETGEEAMANARLIIRAVNNHQNLIDALDDCERCLNANFATTATEEGRRAMTTMNIARIALEKARS